ncbi:uncharacterized protein EMH_0046360 [Eimeria mitis]|uniref:Uncharacterized protein n=1 Tax=Eimeria mitis TaxID=44415 RepID=U6KEC3_9EIME|nr:uncharacterized protein EMH_0046360 [Eimeria mitis]CDJ36304.1 hypothetical protein, conserved [Eimeria mitis]
MYASSTECYYITNNPQALSPGTSYSQQLSLPEKACNGWIIKEDFSASKLFEKNAGLYLASSGFPGGKMRLRHSAQLQRKDQRRTIETAMAAPAALVKQPHYAAANRNITKALDLPSTSSLLADSSSERLMQVFIHGKKHSRCQLTRAAWRAGSTPVGFTLVNKLTPEEGREANLDITGQFCVSCDNAFPVRRPRDAEYANGESLDADSTKQVIGGPNSTFDVFCLSGASLAEASEIARKLTLLTQTVFKVWLESLVVDLIKAWNGKMYFLQVKSFTLRRSGPRVDCVLKLDANKRDEDDEPLDGALKARAALLRRQQASLAQPSVCAMCGLSRSKKSLNRMLNHRMMLEAQHHMRKRGVEILFFHQARKQQLSAESPVCGTCYSLYLAEKELIQLEAELARETGQQISAEAAKLCFVTGILDAIQGSFLMKDPDLLELLQAFDNSCQSTEGDAAGGGPVDELTEDVPESTNDPMDDGILVTLQKHGSNAENDFLSGRQDSDVPVTRDAQGGLIVFRGGEAIQSVPAPQPYDIMLPAALHQWRLMLFLDSLQDPPASHGTGKQKPYLLQLGLFGTTSPVHLPGPDERGVVRIRRMLIFYLFSKSPIVTEAFKEELHFSLRPSGTASVTNRPTKVAEGRAQSAGAQRLPMFQTAAKSRWSCTGASESCEQPTAVGSCSLGRLAGKRSVKNQTCVLLFEGSTGKCRLGITLGLHRDMQVPTQYVSVVPFRDAFLSQTPYCCSCPLPTEWLDCFMAATET